MRIREERPDDRDAIRAVNEAAFGTPAEADLVDALREQARPFISLVAEQNGQVVGHIAFSPLALPGRGGLRVMALAPMSVQPRRQRGGVGSALVRAGLEACQQLGIGAVVVLGHPAYYPRFGFAPASGFGIRSDYPAPDEAFMLLELVPGYLDGVSGTVKYHPAFDSVE